ncbi:MAG: DUF3263 domain-containing protein [Actinobacteria bacterium]|uniref:Unannotated protein n=1 Tax=freshwater metagenome TaxID=449393 RepID=A0A6J5Z9L8_9ZZZZ|nr:DUF3263 domain-containing protein [Actinomycetota bacterium]
MNHDFVTPRRGSFASKSAVGRNIELVTEPLRAVPADTSTGVLAERDQRILEFERQWWKFAGAKEQAIREQFEMSATRYYQVLNAVIDQPEALAFDPMLVKRLQRMRAARARARSARRLGIELN